MRIILLSFLLSLFTTKSDHDIHLSVTDINIEPTGKLTITSKIFLDDLQTAMGLIPGSSLPSKYKGADDLIFGFVNKNLKIISSKKIIELHYKKSESALPAIWVTLESNINPASIKSLSIENTMMCNIYNDQVNMVNVEYKGKKQNIMFSKKHKKTTIAL